MQKSGPAGPPPKLKLSFSNDTSPKSSRWIKTPPDLHWWRFPLTRIIKKISKDNYSRVCTRAHTQDPGHCRPLPIKLENVGHERVEYLRTQTEVQGHVGVRSALRVHPQRTCLTRVGCGRCRSRSFAELARHRVWHSRLHHTSPELHRKRFPVYIVLPPATVRLEIELYCSRFGFRATVSWHHRGREICGMTRIGDLGDWVDSHTCSRWGQVVRSTGSGHPGDVSGDPCDSTRDMVAL